MADAADKTRPPSFVSRETAMRLLGWDLKTWEAALAGGFLPPPVMLGDLRRWKWQEISDRMRGRPPEKPADIGKVGTVYFIEAGNRIKIGFATDPILRLKSLQTGSPSKLTLLLIIPGTIETERQLHHKFRRTRPHGEWFRKTSGLVNFINRRLDREDAA